MITLSEKIKNHALEAETSWGNAYELFVKVIQDRNLMVGAEIGVAFGGHSESILKVPTVVRLYGVDPYQHSMDYIDAMNLPQEEFDELHKFTTSRLSQFGDRYQHIRKPSKQAVNEISEELDFVYIDADHSYYGVWEDLCAWFGMVRDGGVIGGHGYDHPNFPGVKQAIDEFFRHFDWKINVEGEGVWWGGKKQIHISFIMPAYNCSKTITESIESIMDGNFEKGDEIVICNDHSRDETEEVLNALKVKYSGLTVVNHLRNKGGAAARNTAVENSKNDILFCLDSDNILAPGSVPKLKTFMLDSGADVAAFQELRYFSESKDSITHKWIFKEGRTALADYLSGPVVPGASGNYMFTKSSWLKAGGYPEFSGALDTWGFGFRQVATGSKMVVMPDSYYYHRYGHESYWVRDSKMGKISLTALQIIIPYLDLLSEQDVNFIMSKKERATWFENLPKHPIRLHDGTRGMSGHIITESKSDDNNKGGKTVRIIKKIIHHFIWVEQ